MPPVPGSVAVVVVTLNEELNIERCLASAAWADEIIVVDSFSTDRTVEIASRFTQNIIREEYPGYSLQVEKGMRRAASEWVFILDADEEISPALAAAIRAVVSAAGAADGYLVDRKVRVFGKWIEHSGWSPDWQFRLVRRAAAVAEHQEVHGAFTCAGPQGKLAGELFHYTYPTIYSYVEKLNDYTSLHVSNKLRDGHGGAAQRVPLAKLLLSPLSHFLRMFIVNKGYKDGMHGFILAGYSAFYTFLLYAKMWEYGLRQSDGAGLPPITNAQVTHARRKYAPFAEI